MNHRRDAAVAYRLLPGSGGVSRGPRLNGADLQRQCPWETGLAENFGLNLILYRYDFVLTILLDLKRKQCYFIILYTEENNSNLLEHSVSNN